MRTPLLLSSLFVLAACGREMLVESPGNELCGPGTRFIDGACISTVTCATGTHLEGSQCFADTAGLACGAGTLEQAGVCVAQLQCGSGTTQQGTQCIPTAGLSCGAGTVQVGTQCLPSSTLTCGVGTMAVGTQCVPTSTVTCGAGTTLQGSTCVPTGTGSGGWYEVRVGASTVPADGYSKIPVLAIGRLASGAPASDAVVLSLDRSTAGTVQTPGLTLGVLGATTWYIPCSTAGNAACVGPARIRMALNAAPGTPVAESQEFQVVAPAGVGSPAPCLPYDDALFFDGQGYIFTGTQTVTMGTFTPTTTGAPPTVVSFNVDPAQSSQGLWWYADFAAPAGAGPLSTQVYPMAERYPFQSSGNAGLSVTGDGRGCNQSSGRFEIHELVFNAGQLERFVATFEQLCERQQSNVLRGCLKYTR